jgi:hypothetical protein
MIIRESRPGNYPIPSESLLRQQGSFIKGMVKEIGLDGVMDVDLKPFRPESSGQNGKRWHIGYVASMINDSAFAAFAGSGTDKHPVTTVLVTARDEMYSGLWTHDPTQTLFTNSGWVVDHGTIRPFMPSEPVPLDGIILCQDQEYLDNVIQAQIPPVYQRLRDRSEDKEFTERVFSNADLKVPNNSPVKAEWVVFKPKKGAYAEDVYMLPNYHGPSATLEVVSQLEKRYFNTKRYINTHVILQERVIPPAQETLAEIINATRRPSERIASDQVDLKFRIITTVAINPQIVAAEVVFDEFTDRPISVSGGSRVVPIEVLTDTTTGSKLVQDAYDTALRGEQVLFEAVRTNKDEYSLPNYIGFDAIPNRKDGKTYLLEAQIHPGGLQTATRLQHTPLTTIEDVLIPAQLAYCEERVKSRPYPNTKQRLSPLPRFENRASNVYLLRSHIREAREATGVVI